MFLPLVPSVSFIPSHFISSFLFSPLPADFLPLIFAHFLPLSLPLPPFTGRIRTGSLTVHDGMKLFGMVLEWGRVELMDERADG